MKLFEVVARVNDLPEQALRRGQVGTIVEQLAPQIFEVEFADLEGETYAMAPIAADHLMGATSSTFCFRRLIARAAPALPSKPHHHALT